MASSNGHRWWGGTNDIDNSSTSTAEDFQLPKGKSIRQRKKSEKRRRSDQCHKGMSAPIEKEFEGHHLTERLRQIRHYIRQTADMLDTMKSDALLDDDERVAQVQEMLHRLKEQEKKYVQILLVTNSVGDHLSDLEFDRPRIESALGRHTDTELDDDLETGIKIDEASALREQNDLLRQVLHRREELRALQGRQAALLAIRQELREENNHMNLSALSSDGMSQSDNEIVSLTNNTAPSNSSSYAARLNYVRNVGDNKEKFEELIAAGNITVPPDSTKNPKAPKARPGAKDEKIFKNLEESYDSDDKREHKQQTMSELRENQAKIRKLEEVKRKLTELKDLFRFYQTEGDDSLITSASEVTSNEFQYDRLLDAEIKLQQLRMAVDEVEDGARAQCQVDDKDEDHGYDRDDEDDENENGSQDQQRNRNELFEKHQPLSFLQDQLQIINDPLSQVDRSSQSIGIPHALSTTSVTFQEPLPTASNDEIYDRMRQQRILQEQLRDQKKALEDMVRKPKRMVDSRNTRLGPLTHDSEVASAAATSVHSVAAATWGSSENSGRRTAASNGSIHSDDTFIIGGKKLFNKSMKNSIVFFFFKTKIFQSGAIRSSSDKQSKREVKELRKRIDSLTETVKNLQRTNSNVVNEHTTASLQQQHVLLAMQQCLAQLSQQQRDVIKSQGHLNKLINNRKEKENQIKCPDREVEINFSCDKSIIQEKIYAEVANLITLNESRPYFLLDAIRCLQRLSTDLLRQRALYNLRDIVGENDNLSSRSNYTDSDRTSTPPFAHDSLGETIINREEIAKRARDFRAVKSAGLDTKALDNQVKCIMREVTGAIRAHANDVCSSKMLQYLEQVILHSVRRYTVFESHSKTSEKQLGKVLRDSLTKYNSKAVQDCYEELIIDISELLFNELAFTRLLHGLNEKNKKNYAGSTDEMEDEIESAVDEEKFDEIQPLELMRDEEMSESIDTSKSSDDDLEAKREDAISYPGSKSISPQSEEDEAKVVDEAAEVNQESNTAIRIEREIEDEEITIDDLPKEGLNVFAISGLPNPSSSMLAGDGDSLQNPLEIFEQAH